MMGTSATGLPSAPSTATEPGLSEPQRIINTFVSPSKTFTDIRRNASWWVPWLLMSIVSLCFVAAIASKISFEQVSENQIKLNPKAVERLEKATPEQRAQNQRISVTVTKIFSWGSPILFLIILVIVAAVLMGTMNF